MSGSETLATTVSTRGQVILPKTIRKRRGWGSGTRLVVEDTPEGVPPRSAPAFPPTSVDAVFARLRTQGPARTSEEMDAAVLGEAARRRGRD